MARKFQDIAFPAGKYTDKSGNEKTRYQPGGRLITEDDGRQWGTIEFLGMSLKFSVFDQKDQREDTGRGGGSGAVPPSSTGARQPIDDDITF